MLKWLLIGLLPYTIGWAGPSMMIEDCNNGLDDDGDGLIDLNDPDCICKGIKDTFFVPSSLIRNPSFEQFNCCPTGLAQMNCATNWIQASPATSDYFNTCGFRQDVMRGSPPQPLPAGNGYVGFLDLRTHPTRNQTYKEYIGSCLSNTMLAGREYTLSFWIGFGQRGNSYGPRAITTLGIFGTPLCANLPFGAANSWLCPTSYPGWIELAKVTASGTNKWVKVKLKIKPTRDINAIAIGPECNRADGLYYYFMDELLLEETVRFDSIILGIQGNPCSEQVNLISPISTVGSINYQWYKNGIAIPGATMKDFQIPRGEEGKYVLKAIDGNDCELSNVYDYNIDTSVTQLKREICKGDFITIANQRFDSTGAYSVWLKTARQCDSLVQLDLSVVEPINGLIDTSICEGKNISFQGSTYDATGVYNWSAKTRLGCDSLTELRLNVINTLRTQLNFDLCEGRQIKLDSLTIDTSGVYSLLYKSASGCDSVVTANVNLYLNASEVKDTLLCDGEKITIAGTDYSATGSYVIPLQTMHGCDSLLRLNLDIGNVYMTTIDTSFCEGGQLNIGQNIYDQSGNFRLTLQTNKGCDSVFQINLNVLPVNAVKLDTSICEGSVLELGSNQYSVAGTYVVNEMNRFGCDSSFTLNLKVNSNTSAIIDTSKCGSASIRISGVDYSKAGIYLQNHKNATGCDSLLTINIAERPEYIFHVDTVICDGDFIELDTFQFFNQGRYLIVQKSIYGCDSTIDLNLKVNPLSNTKIDTLICFNAQIAIGGKMYLDSGQYIEKLSAVNGCDSIVNIKISKTTKPRVNISTQDPVCYGDLNGQINVSISGSKAPYQYFWNDGDTRSLRTQLGKGNYALVITDADGCSIAEQINLTEPDPLEFDFTQFNPNCINPDYGKLIVSKLSGGVLPYQLLINGQAVALTGNEIALVTGMHTLMLSDSNECSLVYQIDIPAVNEGLVSLNPDSIEVIIGDSVWLNAKFENLDSIRSVEWQGPGNFSCLSCPNTSLMPGLHGGYYTIKVVDQFGCEYFARIYIAARQDIYVPNVFSPNGDNINDFFNLFSDRSVEQIDQLQIFDRWGNLVYIGRDITSNSQRGGWDGTFNGQKCLPGTYVYLFLFRDKLNQPHKLSGNVTLLR